MPVPQSDVFFKAEDGIRDVAVTGVQTCALPISARHLLTSWRAPAGGARKTDRPRPFGPVVWPSSHSGEEPAMPDDVITPDEEQDELTPVAHDDIMKRLLDYQRLLRQEGPPETQAGPSRTMVDHSAREAQAASATATAADEIVDLTEVEESDADVEILEVADLAEVYTTLEAAKDEEEPAAEEADLTERVEQLEASLDRIAGMLAAVRSDLQDLAIRADERIAEIEDALASARGSG